MKTYNEACSRCGKVNRYLYLDETEGTFECDSCGALNRVKDWKTSDFLQNRDFRKPAETPERPVSNIYKVEPARVTVKIAMFPTGAK